MGGKLVVHCGQATGDGGCAGGGWRAWLGELFVDVPTLRALELRLAPPLSYHSNTTTTTTTTTTTSDCWALQSRRERALVGPHIHTLLARHLRRVALSHRRNRVLCPVGISR